MKGMTKKEAASYRKSLRNRRFLGAKCRKMAATRSHRPAIWENMLGTVYALNAEGECRYFDYDHAGALAFAGVDVTNEAGDNRLAKNPGGVSYVRKGPSYSDPRRGQLVLWVKR